MKAFCGKVEEIVRALEEHEEDDGRMCQQGRAGRW